MVLRVLRPRRPLTRLAPTCAFAFLLSSLSCSTVAPPTRVLVSRTPTGDRAMHEEGEPLKVNRWDPETARKGLSRGFFVVKNELEWRTLWPTLEADRIPLLPRDLDFSKEMLLVSSPTDGEAIASEVKSATETEQNGVHVYVTQELPGMGCPAKPKDSDTIAYDLARVRRVDNKDVRFHVDTVRAEPCGDAPGTKITCRPNGKPGTFVDKLSVGPGTDVACIASSTTASRPVFDRTWTFMALPPGSTTKMTVGSGGAGVSFVTDVFGKYVLQLEITDDLQRKGTTTNEVEVAPPKDVLALQMMWTKFDPNEDVTTFPRVELHVLGVTPPEVVKKATVIARQTAPAVKWGKVVDCNVENDKPPYWCVAKVAGSTTVMTLDRTSAPRFAIGVHYTDERVAGQAVLCVRAFRDGKMQTELCDTSPEKEGAWWEPGVIDGESGKTPEAMAQAAASTAQIAAEAAAAAHAASAKLDVKDAGAPSDAGGSMADAGVPPSSDSGTAKPKSAAAKP